MYTNFLIFIVAFSFFMNCDSGSDTNHVSAGIFDSSGNYYVDPSSNSAIEDGSISHPWKSISQLNNNMTKFKPGDNIYFKNGQHYKGSLVVSCIGTSAGPITFTTYGSGNKPVFEYDFKQLNAFNDKAVINIKNTEHVVLNGIQITDSGIDSLDHSGMARVDNGIHLMKSSFVSLKDITISRVGIGVVVQGDNNSIEGCHFINMRMIVNDAKPNNDYGANGIVLSGSGNLIRNNYFSGNWGISHDYGYDGGAIEFFGAPTNNKVMYNTCADNQGFIEFGNNRGGIISDNMMAYNVLINNGNIFYFNNSGKYGVQIRRVEFYNNDVIETTFERSTTPYLFSSRSSMDQSTLYLKNNIFWIVRPVTVVKRTLGPGSFIHQYNVYRLANNVITGFDIDQTEIRVQENAMIFKNIKSPNPEEWDLNLALSSPAIDFGEDLHLSSDLKGHKLFAGKSVDAGAIEKTQ